jgi:hypothetical protein
MDPTAIDHHHDLFVSFAEGGHHLMDILAQLVRIKMGHDLIEDFGGAILDGTKDTEQHPAGYTAPTPIAPPGLALAALFAFDLALAQRPHVQTRTLGSTPPAGSGQGKAPQDRFVFIEQNDLALTSPILQSREFERSIGEVRRVGIEPPGGTRVG